ncbi:tetratricopeptide repeat protein [Gigaspora margarita]|uniref:Tetratricopeptide repeat protein n=1 Tax=Gigaspora margarita TaxID=4874 RepID=A0A8H3XG12_GIGMA|nr:tetratricopeptide repeat protein [Gigaspora margarita]
MAFSIDNYDIFNYINNEHEDEINLGISYLKSVHSNNVLQKLINTLLFHGESFYSLKQYDKALLYYDKVLEFDPFNLIASSFRGKVYYSLGQYYKAFLDLNKALDINPLDMATLLYRGEAL